MTKKYTREDVEAVREIRDALEEQVEMLARICRGDGWAEAYVVNHLKSMVRKWNPYDHDLEDLIEQMERGREPDAEDEAAMELAKSLGLEILRRGAWAPVAGDSPEDQAYELACMVAEDQRAPRGMVGGDDDFETPEWALRACGRAVEEWLGELATKSVDGQ